MERSSQHSPRVDDAMAKDVRPLLQGTPEEARSQEGRLQEGPAEGEHLSAGSRPDDDLPMDEDELSAAEVERRSRLAQVLRPSAFPADRAALLASAEAEQAPAELLDMLRQLPPDGVFANVEAVWEALGGHHEHRT
jgi:hypothetical protein